eukprot:Blabericola_migrator_1__13361@NODE_947_length_5922_cov_60_770623_g657_i0_p2_GENE_NODE_947_length_5922_cov_60_770623_g657_i0NODE_947_length_5922_cov_60_770623_g657_i0_p2_ORF_typecomplete_len313_score68_94SIL1/PF16782_5/3_2e07UNC45central/PF11701_8/0_0013UNC45central/PF11701_8/3_3e02Fes1/PF08609_10/0_042Fes1/PF08609_10/9e02Uso1_p115_head/PF04869_14/0_014CDC14/PF08045_11/0_02CDC14/PF08045_11/1_3e02RTTN_N/PF14726_6/0_13RTTN_N/PF14726_6/2_8e03Drf_GBD/PF06371_13/1e03Drf_GBD/PF06371_13/0_12KAP/PF05804_
MATFDWPGLLKWSLQYSDGTTDGVKARSTEDLEFLEEAIRIAHGMMPDYHKACREAIELLSSTENSTEKLAALSVIQDCLDFEPELARDLANHPDSFKKMLECVSSAEPLALEQACLALSFALANNPKLQQLALQQDGLSIVTTRLESMYRDIKDTDQDSLRLFNRLLGCLSALVKSSAEVERAFACETKRVTLLLEILRDVKDIRVTTKTASLVQHLIAMDALMVSQLDDGLARLCDEAVAAALKRQPLEGSLSSRSLVALLVSTYRVAKPRFSELTEEALNARLRIPSSDAPAEELELLKLTQSPPSKPQ